MAVIYSNAAKDARMDATRLHFADGSLVIMDVSDVVLVTHTLSSNAGTVTNGVWTLGLVNATEQATTGGVAVKAEIRRSPGNGDAPDITGLTVGESAADIIIDSTTINQDQEVTMSSGTITHSVG